MRVRMLQKTAREMVEIAREVAIAGIGLRGRAAQAAMVRARREAVLRQDDERWRAICAAAKRTRFDPASEDDERASTSDEASAHDAAGQDTSQDAQ